MPLKDAFAATKKYNHQSAVLTSLRGKRAEYLNYLKYLKDKCLKDKCFPSQSVEIKAFILAQIVAQETTMREVEAMLHVLEVQIQEVQTFLDNLKPKCFHSFLDRDILEDKFDFCTMALWKSGGIYYVCPIEDLKHILILGDVVFLIKNHRHGCVPILKPQTSKYSSKDLKHVSFTIFMSMANDVVGEITSDALFKWFGWKGIIPFLTFLDDKVVLVGNQLETNLGGGKPFCAQSETTETTKKMMFRFVNGTGVLFDPETLPWFEFQGLLHCTECDAICRNHQKISAHTAVHKEARDRAQLQDKQSQAIIGITTKNCPICLTPSAKDTNPEACNHMQCTVCKEKKWSYHWCFRCGCPRNIVAQKNIRGEIVQSCTPECLDHNMCNQYSLTDLPDGSRRYVITGCKH